jgi:aminoglycoside phosphotransferase (APT) family kinase protein
VIGHGDLGPWNILARESLPVAFIDWDNTGPVDAVWELAQIAWLNAQLHDDDVTEINGLPDTATRLAQCAAILDGYELSSDQRVGFVDKMIELALRSTREAAQTYAITSDTTSPAPDRFPILWAAT